MTTEDLERLVARGNLSELAEVVAPLSEAERKKLSKTAQTLYREVHAAQFDFRNPHGDGPLERLKPYLEDPGSVAKWVGIEQQYAAASLALLAVGPLTQVKKINSSFAFFHGRDGERIAGRDDVLLKVLTDRRPPWIDDWVTALLARDFFSFDWDTLWRMIKEGICQKLESQAYYNQMVQGVLRYDRPNREIPLSDYLVSEPLLLEDVWALFEFDTTAFSYDWDLPADANVRAQSWGTAVIDLAERGVLDRRRLLEATLSAQTKDLNQQTISGMAKLHEHLAPTPDELADLQGAYMDLLFASLTRVVSFGMNMIKKIDQAGRLDDAAYVAQAGRIFLVPTKGPAKTATALLKKIAARSPDLAPQVAGALVEGLQHPAADVQTKVLELLTELREHLDAATAAQIAERLDELPATIRADAAKLAEASGAEVETATPAAVASDLDEQRSEYTQRAAALDARWRELAGVDAALQAIEESSFAPPLVFDPMQVPLLSGLESVEPLGTVEELLEALAHAIEDVPSATEVERILAAMVSLVDQKPEDFDRQAAPLAARIASAEGSSGPKGLGTGVVDPTELAKLVRVWLTGQESIRRNRADDINSKDVRGFIDSRMSEILARIRNREAGPLLATPTHELGWIDPVVIVERWKDLEQRGIEPGRFELMQALLRLAPDGRGAALEQAGELQHPLARALRWALGSSAGPEKSDMLDANIWLAAGRARSPRGALPELAQLGLEQAGPDGVEPAIYQWKAEHAKARWLGGLAWESSPKVPASVQPGRPTILLHVRSSIWRDYEMQDAWFFEWLTMIWPANIDAFLACGASRLTQRLDSTSSSWEPGHQFLPPLFPIDRPWSEVAGLVALLGVAGRDQDVKGLAVDALVEAISDGRAHPQSLGVILTRLNSPNLLKLNRLCENMAEIARVSPLHAWSVLGMLEHLLLAYDELPRDAHFLLALLQQLYAELELPPAEAAVEKLGAIRGSSKTAKLAQALVKFAGEAKGSEANSLACQEARLLMLAGRLERAERWAAAADGS